VPPRPPAGMHLFFSFLTHWRKRKGRRVRVQRKRRCPIVEGAQADYDSICTCVMRTRTNRARFTETYFRCNMLSLIKSVC